MASEDTTKSGSGGAEPASEGDDPGTRDDGAGRATLGLNAAATGPIFWSALAVSAVLVALGFASLNWTLVDFTTSQLILCSGLGILFGAFGSMATIKYKGVVVAGVAAIAIVLLATVDYLIKDDYVIIKIGGVANANKVDMYGDRSYYGAPSRDSYDFIILRRDLERRNVNLLIEVLSQIQGSDQPEPREFIFGCVKRERILSALGSIEAIEWRFDEGDEVLRDYDGEVIASVGPCQSRDAGPEAPKFSWIGELLMGSAFAQGLDMNTLLGDLESDSTAGRRDAREALSAMGPEIIAELRDHLLAPDVSYRTRLGIIVAFTEMMREQKDQRVTIGASIDEALLSTLIQASADPDRTIRIYASEFLYDLGDPRSAKLALNAFDDADDNGKYNLLLVVQGAYPYLTPEEKQTTDVALKGIYPGVGPDTKELIRGISPQVAER
jgi:hypothetical protein